MRSSRDWLAVCLAWSILPVSAWADPPIAAPTNQAVLLPPQVFDDAVKYPNTTKERYGQWSIAGGVYFFEPVFQNNPAFLVNAAGGNLTRQVDFNYHLDVGPNVWIGYVSESGWGIRGRWFQFDRSSSTGFTTTPGETITGISALGLGQVPVAGTIGASGHLAVNMLDFQGTCSHEGPKWSYLLGFGVRYTHMSQDYQATLTSAATRIDLTSGHNFNGVGPSFSLEGKRCLGASGFAVYGQMHGAILFGNTNEGYAAVNNGTLQEFTRSPTGVLPVGELEIGVEYRRNVGRAQAFVQTGFAGQVWWGGGDASNLDPVGPVSAAHNNFGFVGLALRGGVRY